MDEKSLVFDLEKACVVKGEGHPGNDVVDMDMGAKVPPPCLNDTKESDLTTHKASVLCEILEGRGRGRKEKIIEEALMGTEKTAKLGGYGKGDKEIGHWEEPVELFFDPGLDLIAPALRTMATVTGMVGIRKPVAARAGIHLAPEGRGAAAPDLPDCLFMGKGHGITKAALVLLPIQIEKIRDFRIEDPAHTPRGLLQIGHDLVDGVPGKGLGLGGEMGITGGGLR